MRALRFSLLLGLFSIALECWINFLRFWVVVVCALPVDIAGPKIFRLGSDFLVRSVL